MHSAMKDDLAGALAQMRTDGLYKEEGILTTPQGRVIGVGGEDVLNLCANNYLGLADHPRLLQAAHEGLDRWGVSPAARDRFLGIIEGRCKTRRNGASWQSETVAAVTAELELARGADARYDDAVKRLSAELGDPDQLPMRARRIAGLLALCLQASLLLRFAPDGVADAFCATRLGGDWGAVLGTLPPTSPVAALVDRARITTV